MSKDYYLGFDKLSSFIDTHVTACQARNDNFKRPKVDQFYNKAAIWFAVAVCIGNES